MKDITDIFNRYRSLNYTKNSTIIPAFDTPREVFYIQSGFIRMYMSSKDGRELTLSILSEKAFFPMISAIGNIENIYNFQAYTDVRLIKAPLDVVLNYLKTHPDELYGVTNRIFRGVNGLLSSSESLFFGSAKEKVVTTLQVLYRRFGKIQSDKSVRIDLPLTHRDIACLCGLSRETVTLEVNKLVKKKILQFKKHYCYISDKNSFEEIMAS